MIPVARRLLELGHNVIIAAGEEHISLFKSELPGLNCIRFPGFKPGYSRFLPQYVTILFKVPVLVYWIVVEHSRLRKLIAENKIDIVISDNRFGLWNKNAKTVYITHMPRIPFPRWMRFMEWTGILLHRFIIRKYSMCFIPDLPGENNVSGRLSHGVKLPVNTRFIGILSRFGYTYKSVIKDTYNFPHCTLILSGPEPQRSILRKKVNDIPGDNDLKTVILEGKPSEKAGALTSGRIISYNHLPQNEMEQIISGSEFIVSRAGYTTIMELISLNCSALLIPTPGQTEQEYLARYLDKKGWFAQKSQNRLGKVMKPQFKRPIQTDEILAESRELFEKALEELLKDHNK
jgi:hypothetical protein